ncbi:hypothetical protein A4S06_09230 [Erysipelotrichaceae bacterium MTC7]|nr:hypothetical protein A4S06_09230 [Erysipelotrichaceae bacterium MTC7]
MSFVTLVCKGILTLTCLFSPISQSAISTQHNGLAIAQIFGSTQKSAKQTASENREAMLVWVTCIGALSIGCAIALKNYHSKKK